VISLEATRLNALTRPEARRFTASGPMLMLKRTGRKKKKKQERAIIPDLRCAGREKEEEVQEASASASEIKNNNFKKI
jgi:hypothetical protein